MTVTLLADYGLLDRDWIPSGAVVELLGEFGVTPGSARAAISRLARKSMLESDRRGRRTAYRLTSPAAAGLAAGGALIARIPAQAEAWDGRWTVVTFSLPDAGDAPRRALRQNLRWLGFAPLYDGVWVSPRTLPDPMLRPLGAVGRGAVTVFRARQVTTGPADRDPLGAWDLAAIERRYRAFVDEWSPLLSRAGAGDVGGVEALQARTEVMDTYRHFLTLDPPVPLRLMPPDWPRQQAHDVFAAVYDGLLDVALRHVTETVARHADTTPPPQVRGHTVAELGAGLPMSGPPPWELPVSDGPDAPGCASAPGPPPPP